MDSSLILYLFLISLLFGPSCETFESISESVESLLKLQNIPTRVPLLLCNESVETNLVYKVNSMGVFAGKFKPTNFEDGGQKSSFIILDLECPVEKVQEALKSSHLNVVYSRWLILNTKDSQGAVNDEKILQSVLMDTPIGQSTELFYFYRKMDETSITLKQAFKKFKVDNSSVILEDVGEFNDNQEFRNMRKINTTVIRRKDMQGTEFKLAIILENPDSINHLEDYVDTVVDPLTKNTLRLAKVITEAMNAKPVLMVTDNWGNIYPPANNWTGNLGNLVAGYSEFSGSPYLVRSTRLVAVDYISEAIRSGTMIVFRAPKLSYTANVFLMPFHKLVWGLAILLLFTIISLLTLSNWYEWNILVPAEEIEPGRDMLTPRFSDSLFLVLGNAFVQGSPTAPRSTTGRIILISCLIFLVCLYVSYCAFIVALLQTPSNGIRTVADLLDSQIEVGSHDAAYLRFWLPRLVDPMDRELFHKRILNKDGTDNFLSMEEGVNRIQKGLYAFNMEGPIGYRLVLQQFTEHEKCDLREIKFGDLKSPYLVSRKHSVFKEYLRIMALKVKESGVQTKLWKEIYVTKPKCTQKGTFTPLALMDIRPVIYAYIAGVCLSFTVLLLEVLVHKYMKAPLTKQNMPSVS